MRKLLLLLPFLFLYFISHSQTWIPRSSNAVTPIDYYLKVKGMFYLPVAGDTTLSGGLDSLGAHLLVIKSGDTSLYVRVPRTGGNKWKKVLMNGDILSGAGGLDSVLKAGNTTVHSAIFSAIYGASAASQLNVLNFNPRTTDSSNQFTYSPIVMNNYDTARARFEIEFQSNFNPNGVPHNAGRDEIMTWGYNPRRLKTGEHSSYWRLENSWTQNFGNAHTQSETYFEQILKDNVTIYRPYFIYALTDSLSCSHIWKGDTYTFERAKDDSIRFAVTNAGAGFTSFAAQPAYSWSNSSNSRNFSFILGNNGPAFSCASESGTTFSFVGGPLSATSNNALNRAYSATVNANNQFGYYATTNGTRAGETNPIVLDGKTNGQWELFVRNTDVTATNKTWVWLQDYAGKAGLSLNGISKQMTVLYGGNTDHHFTWNNSSVDVGYVDMDSSKFYYSFKPTFFVKDSLAMITKKYADSVIGVQTLDKTLTAGNTTGQSIITTLTAVGNRALVINSSGTLTGTLQPIVDSNNVVGTLQETLINSNATAGNITQLYLKDNGGKTGIIFNGNTAIGSMFFNGNNAAHLLTFSNGVMSVVYMHLDSNQLAIKRRSIFQPSTTPLISLQDSAGNVIGGLTADDPTNIWLGKGPGAIISVAAGGVRDIGIGVRSLNNNTSGSDDIVLGDSSVQAAGQNPTKIISIGHGNSKTGTIGTNVIELGNNISPVQNVGNNTMYLGSNITSGVGTTPVNTIAIGQGITAPLSNVIYLGRNDQNTLLGADSTKTDAGQKLQVFGAVSVIAGNIPAFIISGGQYNGGGGSQFLLSGSTIANPITGGGGTVTDFSSANFNGNTLTATNAMTYTSASTLLISGPPVASTNVTITNGYSLKVGTGMSTFGGMLVNPVTENSAGTLTLDNTNVAWTFTGTTSTWTLPALSISKGFIYHIKNAGSGNLTLSRAGSDQIYDTGAVSTITITPGSAVIIVGSTSFWYRE
jgi:hypothetical protein